MQDFEIIEHTADVGLIAYGQSLKQVFENAAKGMFSIIIEPENVRADVSATVSVEANDVGSLLVAWLNELLYIFDARKMLVKDFQITDWDERTSLTADIAGETVDERRHTLSVQIKACTYHMLSVAKNDVWRARVIFDV